MGAAIPGESLLYKLFNTIGETLPSMALARQAVTMAKGRPQSTSRRPKVRRTHWRRWCSRSPPHCSPSTGRRAADGAGHHHPATTW